MFYIILASFITLMILLFMYSLRAIKLSFDSKKAIKTIKFSIITSISIILISFGFELASRMGYKIIKFVAVDRVSVLGWLLVSIPLICVFILSVPLEIAEFIKKSRLKTLRKLIWAVALTMFVFVGISFMTPNTTFETRIVKLKIENLPNELKGFKILQLSDIHVGNLTKNEQEALLTVLTPQCNELDADVITLTGDLVTSLPEEMLGNEKFLEKLNAKYKKLFIFGNHDIGMYNHGLSAEEKNADIDSIASIMNRCGFEVLSDEIINIKGLNFLGVDEASKDDYMMRYNKLTDSLTTNDIVIALSHNPMFYSQILESKFTPQLTLAGHTHASQFEVLGFSISDCIFEYARGLYKENNNYIYVNRGIGYHFFRRIGSKPEITLFELY